MAELIDLLIEQLKTGVHLGLGFYKIRLSIRSKGKGKSGGARVITFVRIAAETVYLVTICDKTAQFDVDVSELLGLV